MSDEIRKFIAENEARLKAKDWPLIRDIDFETPKAAAYPGSLGVSVADVRAEVAVGRQKYSLTRSQIHAAWFVFAGALTILRDATFTSSAGRF